MHLQRVTTKSTSSFDILLTTWTKYSLNEIQLLTERPYDKYSEVAAPRLMIPLSDLQCSVKMYMGKLLGQPYKYYWNNLTSIVFMGENDCFEH